MSARHLFTKPLISFKLTAHKLFECWLAHSKTKRPLDMMTCSQRSGLLKLCSKTPTSPRMIRVFAYSVPTEGISSILFLNAKLVACRQKTHGGFQKFRTKDFI